MRQYHSKNHFTFKIKYHIVFVCKYRKRLLKYQVDEDIKQILFEIAKGNNKFEIELMESDKDHIHLMVNACYDISSLQIVKLLKGKSTVEIWKLHPELKNHFWKENTFWTDGSFVCSIGDASSETIQRYIEEQGKCY